MTIRVSCAASLLAVLCAGCIDEQPREATGAELFATHCASCHGAGAAGDGPVSDLLTVEVPDLRGLARRSGGDFDEGAVLARIDGRAEVAAHGPRTMPVWGRLFVSQHEGEPMPVYAAMGDTRALVDHLRSIQQH